VARALALVILLVIPMTLAGSAHAQPGGVDEQTPGTGEQTGTTLPWPTLGLPSTVNLYGTGETTYSMPLPNGLAATRLQGMLHQPMNVDVGFVEIDDGEGNFLASIDLTSMPRELAVIPFDVDISAAGARASTTKISFRIRERDDVDWVCDPPPQLELSNLATVVVGAQLPVTTVADFFGPVLGKATIYAPADANPAEQEAVLTLASALARLYGDQQLSIEVVRQARGATPPPVSGFDRSVVVETGEPGLSIEDAGTPNVYLRISGDDEGLVRQVSLIATQLQTLAQVSTASVGQAGSVAVHSEDTLMFKQLNVGGEKTSFLGNSFLQVGIQRASLGRFDNVEVHLLADYTPVPVGDAASVVVRAQDLVVYRATLDNSGYLDATFDLDPSELAGQFINLEFTLTYTPDQPCGPLLAPMTFQIDPRSTLTMHRGGAPLGGFGAFPSEFGTKFLVALDGSGPNQLSYAARVIAAIARLNKVEITPQVVDLQTAADATSGALIVADSNAVSQTSLKPPVSGNGSVINFALPTELKVNIDQGLGSIQAFADPSRSRSVVLVTTTADWTLVDPLFSYIDGPAGDWSLLTGDVLAAGAVGTPVNVAIRTADHNVESAPSSDSASWHYAYIAAGVLAAIAVLVLILYLLLRRRARISRTQVGADCTNDSG